MLVKLLTVRVTCQSGQTALCQVPRNMQNTVHAHCAYMQNHWFFQCTLQSKTTLMIQQENNGVFFAYNRQLQCYKYKAFQSIGFGVQTITHENTCKVFPFSLQISVNSPHDTDATCAHKKKGKNSDTKSTFLLLLLVCFAIFKTIALCWSM
ncbi:hypothetical protein VPH35_001288 [Triticum aestivum]